ncbi:MAG: thioesterase family protein [Acholeplasmataceae bacterium]|nr:thioesterase family protein [Acidaminococcaceae bacterium]NLY84268.1 thioesterase family protein [Acholeplasmataceae bacterium]
MQKLQLGLVATVKETVLHTNTASALGSGGLDVYATPAMVALMEQAAVSAIRPALAEGSGSVGTLLNIRHERATLPGSRVSASAELVEIDGRRLVFKVRAEDESGLVGSGLHERFIIANDKFLAKLHKSR